MDPLHYFAGHDVVLEHLPLYFTNDDACRASQASHEWRKWIANTASLWKRLFAEQEWTLPEEVDPFVLYSQHKRMKLDMDRGVEGMNAILGPPTDGMSLSTLKDRGILLHESEFICNKLRAWKNNELLDLLREPGQLDAQRVELYRSEEDHVSCIGSLQIESGIRDVQFDDGYVGYACVDGMGFAKRVAFYKGAAKNDTKALRSDLNLRDMVQQFRNDVQGNCLAFERISTCGNGKFVVTASAPMTKRNG